MALNPSSFMRYTMLAKSFVIVRFLQHEEAWRKKTTDWWSSLHGLHPQPPVQPMAMPKCFPLVLDLYALTPRSISAGHFDLDLQ